MISEPNYQLANLRIAKIERAINAIKRAQTIGIYTTEFDHAIENMNLAKLQTRINLDNQVALWIEEQRKEIES